MKSSLSTAVASAVIFTALSTLDAEAESNSEVFSGIESQAGDLISLSNTGDSVGGIFSDNYSTVGVYSLVSHNNNSHHLRVIMDTNIDLSIINDDDTLFVQPPKSINGMWGDNQELNAKWLTDLLNSELFSGYETIELIGKGDSADFITQSIISTTPQERIKKIYLIDGGEYVTSRLTKASYNQLLNMEIDISHHNQDDANKISKSFSSRGFQNIRILH